jgi:hypothetical protein
MSELYLLRQQVNSLKVSDHEHPNDFIRVEESPVRSLSPLGGKSSSVTKRLGKNNKISNFEGAIDHGRKNSV